MYCSLPTVRRVIVLVIVGALLPMAAANAQPSGYQAPSFAGMAAQANYSAQRSSAFPASPLAGGPAAAQGGEFMDVHGQPIVMPASYCQSCPAGSCGPSGGGYGCDPMAIDFGGYGQDQCGPHYFDVSADVVYLSAVDLFDGVGAFGAVTAAANSPRVLNPNDSDEDYEPGWQIAARYDIGALALLEATYMGLYDIGFSDRVVSTDVTTNPPNQPFQLVSVFSDFGINPIDGLDQAEVFTLDYEADLQSTEISYRRYWVGTNPRVSGSWLLGARYLRFTEDLRLGSEANVLGVTDFSSRLWSGENDMVGFQFGGDGWVCLRQGLRVGCEAKSGVYNNRFRFRHAGDFPEAALPPAGTAPADFDVSSKGDQVAFAAEGGVTVVADILPSWSIRGGYQVLYLNSLATAGGNVDPTNVSSTVVLTQDDALFHGFTGGFEYIW